MPTALLVYTRDLRVHDQPALAAATAGADRVVPAFVFDDRIWTREPGSPNRARFLLEAVADLDRSLRGRGSSLVLRRGDWLAEVMRLAVEVDARGIFVTSDVSAFAERRERSLRRACDAGRRALRLVDGATVVPPGALAPAGGSSYKVFTPYWRRWDEIPWREPVAVPARLPGAVGVSSLPAPSLRELTSGATSPALPPGGEREARRRLDAWLAEGVERYGERHDDLAGDATSRLSAYLRFGCLSPLEAATRARAHGGEGARAFVRQLAWRDFFAQIQHALPSFAARDLRPRTGGWREDPAALVAWQRGRTGYPIVDAGMRQLVAEGWMHNRARLVVASFLTKTLGIDWREGARWFMRWLVDGDVASNSGNWQWMAGTGNDTRPNRVLNPLRQAARFDPEGDFVRRYVPELATVPGAAVHEPWMLEAGRRRSLDYPERIVDHAEGARRFRERRAGQLVRPEPEEVGA